MGSNIPACVDVSLPAVGGGDGHSPLSQLRRGEFQSPIHHGAGSCADRFGSPVGGGSVKRRLAFGGGGDGPPTGADAGGASGQPQQGQLVHITMQSEYFVDFSNVLHLNYCFLFFSAQTSTGEIKYIQVPAIAVTVPQSNASESAATGGGAAEPAKPMKPGPLGLFFRKVRIVIF